MNISSVQQSSDALAQILKMSVTESADMAKKMIPLSLAAETETSSNGVLGSLLDVTV